MSNRGFLMQRKAVKDTFPALLPFYDIEQCKTLEVGRCGLQREADCMSQCSYISRFSAS